MSTPENPLAQYYTYSYHHIFVACENTEVAEAIQSSNDFNTFLRTSQQQDTPDNPYGKFTATDFQGLGGYVIIINGMVDSEFVIKDARWMSVTASSAGMNGADQFSSMALEGSITVQEPRGVKFMNVFSYVADQLETDPNGIIFLLKTIFVGYPAPGVAYTTQTQPSTGEMYNPIMNIRPVLFLMIDLTGEFDITGGTYVISWAGINNGASKQNHIMRATDRVKINMGGPGAAGPSSKTLGGALKQLEAGINKVYKDFYDSAIEDMKKGQCNLVGRKVVYKIIAEEPYASQTGVDEHGMPTISYNPEYIVDDFAQQSTDTGKKGDAGILDLGTSPSVESSIMQIVNRCSKVKDDATITDSEQTGTKTRYVPKVVSTVVSTKTEYIVVYKVRRMIDGRAQSINKSLDKALGQDSAAGGDGASTLLSDIVNNNIDQNDQSLTRNLLTLDYFFTGKNTDILDFDLKMQGGLMFFQTLVSTDTFTSSQAAPRNSGPTQAQSLSPDGNPVITNEKQAVNQPSKPLCVRPNTPIFFSTKLDDRMSKNTANPGRAANFQALLSRQAALENLEAKVRIHGNPGLLNSTAKQPREVANHMSPDQTDADDSIDAFPYWETSPALVKLNIRMPTDDEDQDFSTPFWYEGFYYCFGVTHMFNEGEFVQELDMISLPQNTPQDAPAQTNKTSSEQQQETDNQATSDTTPRESNPGAVASDLEAFGGAGADVNETEDNLDPFGGEGVDVKETEDELDAFGGEGEDVKETKFRPLDVPEPFNPKEKTVPAEDPTDVASENYMSEFIGGA